jgi:CheY-like chemotaxis protein
MTDMVLLCIDDDNDDLDFFIEAVGTINSSYRCIKAMNGEQGLAILKSVVPDYIFLDINMPGMGGKEVLKLIRAERKLDDVPVIMLSTYINTEDVQEYKRKGANECIVKPPSFTKLCKTLETVFSQ